MIQYFSMSSSILICLRSPIVNTTLDWVRYSAIDFDPHTLNNMIMGRCLSIRCNFSSYSVWLRVALGTKRFRHAVDSNGDRAMSMLVQLKIE